MKDKKVLIIVLFVLIILIGCGIYFFNKKDEPNNVVEDNNIEEKENTVKEDEEKEVKVVTDNYEYYLYEKEEIPEGADSAEAFTVYKKIYLYNNGKYYYNYADYGDSCDLWSYGSYIISSDSIKLTEEYRGDCDECYYNTLLGEYTFKINKDTLVSDEKEILERKQISDSNKPTFDIKNYSLCK